MSSNLYHSIDEVFTHFKRHGGAILTDEEMDYCGIQYLCNEKGLWIISERLHYDKRVPVFNTKYIITANLLSYMPELEIKSTIDIMDMRERPKYGER
jgi:hypothetical protein